MASCNPRHRTNARWHAIAVLLACAGLGACSEQSDRERVDTVDRSRDYEERNVGYLKNGEKHGTWHMFIDGELYRRTTWRHGVQHGPFAKWNDDDRISSDGYYKNGKRHGRRRGFRGNDGRLTSLGWVVADLMHGDWCEWDDDGKLLRVTHYRWGHVQREQPGPCPYTASGMGQHHFDPDDRTYLRRTPRSGKRRRSITLLP